MGKIVRHPDMIPTRSAGPTRRTSLLLAAAIIAALPSSAPVAAQDIEFPVTIRGAVRGNEDFVVRFSAVLPDRPMKVDADGLSPEVIASEGGAIPIPYEPPMTFVWDFGDGTPPVEVEEYGSVSHVYDDDGQFTIQLTVRDDRGVHGSDSREITIANVRPRTTRVAAVEVEPGTQTVEFTASAADARDDELTYRWDFGDGGSDEGVDLWRVRHSYSSPGEYEAVVTFVDDDGGERADSADVVVTGAAIVAEEETQAPGPAPESVISGFEATLSQGVSGTFDGYMRSFAGLHFGRISDGRCRFLFSAWDPGILGSVVAIMDLNGVPEGGGRYTIRSDWLNVGLTKDAEEYEATGNQGLPGFAGDASFGGLIQALSGGLLDLLPAADRARVVDMIGLDPTAAARNEEVRPMATVSPFGLGESQGFHKPTGTLELTFVPGERATGIFDVVLENTTTDPPPPPGLETLRLEGTFVLDLQAARREGLIRYDECGPRELEVTAHFPDPDEKHYSTLKPPVRVAFNRPLNPATVGDETVQIVYPSLPDGDLVRVPARMLRDRRTVWLIPERDLQPGARYTLRVRTGDEGVRGRDGSTMAGDEEWWSFDFETLVDLVPEPGSDQVLACNLFQTARDAPLIRGKPAVARVAARWRRPEGVHPSAHVESFEARAILYDGTGEVASASHRFVRPDLYAARGVNMAAAEHTAQIYGFRPDPETAPVSYGIGLEVPTSDGNRTVRYRGGCPISHWDLAPVITIDYVAFEVGEWKTNPAELEAVMPTLREIVAEAEAYALQLFPVAEIRGGDIRVVPERSGQVIPVWCIPRCFGPSVMGQLKSESDADIVVGFVPHDSRSDSLRQQEAIWTGLTGGNTSSMVSGGQGVVVSLASRSVAWFPRYVHALVHEWGHALTLAHIPFGDPAEYARAAALRDGDAPIKYKGVEGFRLTPDGDAGWNKSSVEGNEEGAALVPLMFPSTIPYSEAFIANHHYREIQAMFERLGWSRNAGG